MNIKRIRWIASFYSFYCRIGHGHVNHSPKGWYWIAYRRKNGENPLSFDVREGGPFKSVLEAKKEAEKFMRGASNDIP